MLVRRRRPSRLKGRHKKGTNVQQRQASQGKPLSIYGQPHHRDQCRRPQIPNRTIPGEALFLSTGPLVFRTSVVVALGVRRMSMVVLSAKHNTLSGSVLLCLNRGDVQQVTVLTYHSFTIRSCMILPPLCCPVSALCIHEHISDNLKIPPARLI